MLTSVSAALDYSWDEFDPQYLSNNECSGRPLSTTSRELADPVLSMLSTDIKSKQEAEGKYCVCFTGLHMYTDQISSNAPTKRGLLLLPCNCT